VKHSRYALDLREMRVCSVVGGRAARSKSLHKIYKKSEKGIL